jgi:hypothetical protein
LYAKGTYPRTRLAAGELQGVIKGMYPETNQHTSPFIQDEVVDVTENLAGLRGSLLKGKLPGLSEKFEKPPG